MPRRRVSAFTLIEVLIVVVIIAILATVIVVGVGGVGKKTRDDRRISDAHAIAAALDQYATEHKRKYPLLNPSSSQCTAIGSEEYCFVLSSNSNLKEDLVDYLSPLPVDPANKSGFRYAYVFSASAQQFAVVVDKFERDRTGCNIPETGGSLPSAVSAYIKIKGGERPCYYVSR